MLISLDMRLSHFAWNLMGYLSRKSAKQMTSNKEDLFYYKGNGMLRPELETLCTFGEFVCLLAY